ncbi:MAG: hypothetical protein ACXACP_04675, partial [Candidatus Hodarchaeales archaeon]
MIDSKTRKKVISLWKNGENKASIQRKTKVSQPSIRKIINEIELEEGTPIDQRDRKNRPEKPEKRVQRISTVFEDDKSLIYHKFILNFSKVLPLKRLKGNPLQVLAQGISIRIYRELLGKVFDSQSVAAIDAQLQSYDLSGHVFEVTLEQGLYGIHKIQIQQLTTKETRFWYTL